MLNKYTFISLRKRPQDGTVLLFPVIQDHVFDSFALKNNASRSWNFVPIVNWYFKRSL